MKLSKLIFSVSSLIKHFKKKKTYLLYGVRVRETWRGEQRRDGGERREAEDGGGGVAAMRGALKP